MCCLLLPTQHLLCLQVTVQQNLLSYTIEFNYSFFLICPPPSFPPFLSLVLSQILTNLLHDVAVHSNDSRMDSNSLAVVLTPNIFSSLETKKGKKSVKGGGVGPGDIKSMTSKFMIMS